MQLIQNIDLQKEDIGKLELCPSRKHGLIAPIAGVVTGNLHQVRRQWQARESVRLAENIKES